MSARTELAAQLKTSLPRFRVIGFNNQLDAITQPTVMLWQSELERFDQISHEHFKVTLDLWVLTGRENPEKADDDLDDALLKVVEALRPLTWVDWTNAVRGVLLEQFHGYKLTVSALAKIGE